MFWQRYNWIIMNCTIYMVNCHSTIHITCPLALTTYKYKLQMFNATQKLSCKTSCKTVFFSYYHQTLISRHFLQNIGQCCLWMDFMHLEIFCISFRTHHSIVFHKLWNKWKIISIWRLCVGYNTIFWQDVGIFILVTLVW